MPRPEDAGEWEDLLSESLRGLPSYRGSPDPVENPPVPAMVAEVMAEEQCARDLVRELFVALLVSGARAYAGPAVEAWDEGEWDMPGPFFFAVVEGRRVAYEGGWLLKDVMVPASGEEGLRALPLADPWGL